MRDFYDDTKNLVEIPANKLVKDTDGTTISKQAKKWTLYFKELLNKPAPMPYVPPSLPSPQISKQQQICQSTGGT
jgi:hypothetical protein